jgi:hypothetical protein
MHDADELALIAESCMENGKIDEARVYAEISKARSLHKIEEAISYFTGNMVADGAGDIVKAAAELAKNTGTLALMLSSSINGLAKVIEFTFKQRLKKDG